MQCYEGQIMSIYFFKALKRVGVDMEWDELMLWDMMHAAGLESFAALLELDDDAIYSIATSNSMGINNAA